MSRGSLLDLIDRPGGLVPLVQPIVEATSTGTAVRCLEFLIQGPEGTNLFRADVLFEYVRRRRATAYVDRRCVETIIETARRLPPSLLFSINVHATTLEEQEDFPDFVAKQMDAAGIAFERLILEVVEHLARPPKHSFRRTIELLRSYGFSIALDDVGVEQANYRLMHECLPDYYKLDRYFSRGVHRDAGRRAVVASLSCFASEMGGRVIAEGVEEADELEALRALGVSFFQGHLFGRPMQATELDTASWRAAESEIE